MFDGIKLTTEIPDGARWLIALQARPNAPRFFTTIDTESAEIKTRHYDTHTTTERRATVGQYRVTVTECDYRDGTKKTRLTIDGSLHKNRFGGTNYQPFKLSLLVEEIRWIEETFCIGAERLEIQNLEFGVNLSVPFDVSNFIERQALLFGTHEMTPYKPANGYTLGRYHEPKQGAERVIKLYDKGLQNNLPFHLMRYELRYKKMRELKALGITHLSDLLTPDLYPALLDKLLSCWDNMLIAHPFTEKEREPLPDAELLKNGCYRDFWKETHRERGNDRFKYLRTKYRALLTGQGKHIQTEIRALIREEWKRLSYSPDAVPKTENYPKSPFGEIAKTERPQNRKNQVLPKIPIKINGDFGEQDSTVVNTTERGDNSPIPDASKVRRCLSCNKDISHQPERTLFCSAKFVGEQEAHRCRNAFHNRQRDMRKRAHQYRDGNLFNPNAFLVIPTLRLSEEQTGYKYRIPPPLSPPFNKRQNNGKGIPP